MKNFVNPIGSGSNRQIFDLIGEPTEDKIHTKREVVLKNGRKKKYSFVEVTEVELAVLLREDNLHFILLKQESSDEPVRFVREVK